MWQINHYIVVVNKNNMNGFSFHFNWKYEKVWKVWKHFFLSLFYFYLHFVSIFFPLSSWMLRILNFVNIISEKKLMIHFNRLNIFYLCFICYKLYTHILCFFIIVLHVFCCYSSNSKVYLDFIWVLDVKQESIFFQMTTKSSKLLY